MVWWEAVLSPALQFLFDKLASGEILNILKTMLDDAEEKQYLNLAIETWINMLRDVVFEADDTLDELATEALRCKIEPILSQQGDQRSKIIVTTRNEGAASIIGTLAPYRLQEMSHDACWSLFLHHAFGHGRGVDMHMSLKEIGKEIVKRPVVQITMEDVGNGNFTELQSRKTCIQLEENWKSRFYQNCEKAHYFSCIRSKYDVFRKFEMPSDVKRLRTFLPLAPLQGAEFCYLTKKTEIKCLPQSFSDLYNLRTLLLHNCDYLIELPADIGKLLNLRYLDVSGSGIQKIPLGLDTLVRLRTLPEFVVGINVSSIRTLPEFTVGTNISDQKRISYGIGELSNLLHLEGSLSILNLENVDNVDNVWDAHKASLITKKQLTELLL
ncbi:hypothetical protein RND71_026253 [Anisodus tanguticus]|uniref:Disease resistance N-terminal domain-containing protein n=1 Tax=Anisodus tanguticus TaxID=243964 RepID=A0AAE1RKH6_9SOLA|nr:hypothetical protein RND71_026253 [Anisodus tanguticus]